MHYQNVNYADPNISMLPTLVNWGIREVMLCRSTVADTLPRARPLLDLRRSISKKHCQNQLSAQVTSWLGTLLTPADRPQIYGRPAPSTDPGYAMSNIVVYGKGKNADKV